MPDIKTDNGCIIHVEVEGPQNAPVLMLSNSLGTNLHMWDDQAPAWSRQFRLVRYDRRGHGQSSVPKGPYPMERLGRDVLAVIDALGIAKISWCGLSMGGMVGQWLGANAPARVDKLILSNTSSYFADKALWEGRLKTVREKGLAAIVDANMAIAVSDLLVAAFVINQRRAALAHSHRFHRSKHHIVRGHRLDLDGAAIEGHDRGRQNRSSGL